MQSAALAAVRADDTQRESVGGGAGIGCCCSCCYCWKELPIKVSVMPALVAWALLEFQFRGLSRDDAGRLDAPHKADGEQIRKKLE